jgi:hypothetical protein
VCFFFVFSFVSLPPSFYPLLGGKNIHIRLHSCLLTPRIIRVDEEVIETRCDELRKKLLADSNNRSSGGGGPVRRNFKAHQVHELADAKLKESERLRQALKISKSYEEGTHWRKQEERSRMALERGNEDAGGGPVNAKRERDEGRRDIRDRDRRRDMDRAMDRGGDRSRSRSRSRSIPRAKAWDDGGDRDRPRVGVRDRDRDRNREGDRERYRERDRGDRDRHREQSEERGRDRDDGSDRSSNPRRALSPERSRSRDARDRYRD